LKKVDEKLDSLPFVSNVSYVMIDQNDSVDELRAWVFSPIEDMPTLEEMLLWAEISEGLTAEEALAVRSCSLASCPGDARVRSNALLTLKRRRRSSIARGLGAAVKKFVKPAFKRRRTTSIHGLQSVFPSFPADFKSDAVDAFVSSDPCVVSSADDDIYTLSDEMLSWVHVNGGRRFQLRQC
jgi:hypothetical protein